MGLLLTATYVHVGIVNGGLLALTISSPNVIEDSNIAVAIRMHILSFTLFIPLIFTLLSITVAFQIQYKLCQKSSRMH